MAKPELPSSMKRLFKNNIFKLAILFLIVYLSKNDKLMAFLVAVAFMITINLISDDNINTLLKQIKTN